MKNIKYSTDQISKYYSTNRIRWNDFYISERQIMESIRVGQDSSVLDIGCGCGGLGIALKERFQLSNYTGVEINDEAIVMGKSLNANADLIAGDIIELSRDRLAGINYDLVFSLSCVDWNIDFNGMLNVAWSHVKPGGWLISTFRITNQATIKDISKSYQYINFSGEKEGEVANYVVVSFSDLMMDLLKLKPSSLKAFGYWGAPSATAVTPFSELCFTAIALQKSNDNNSASIDLAMNLPLNVINF